MSQTTPTGLTHIIVTRASEHNLKAVSLAIPKNQLICFTGVSGSGKSSLAFDTLYAEGQRRYVESLSSYARQFLGIMQKPDVEQIEGLTPAISIDQKTTSQNPRSTVGTITEIYDYLRLLYARVGHPECPNCGREISTQTVDQMADQVWNRVLELGQPVTRLQILSPIIRRKKGSFQSLFDRLRQQGYTKVRVDNTYFNLDEEIDLLKTNRHSISVILKNFIFGTKQMKDAISKKELLSQIRQSLEEALKLADGLAIVCHVQDQSFDFPISPKQIEDWLFSEKYACGDCNISLKELEPRLFSFNAPHGACPNCNGLGSILKIDVTKIIAPSLTLSEGAIIPFARTLSSETWWARLVKEVVKARDYDYDYDYRKTAYQDFDPATQKILLYGSDKIYTVVGPNRFGQDSDHDQQFEGFIKNLERRFLETDSDFIRKEISQFMHKQVCAVCQGQRLNPDALAVKVANLNIADLTKLPVMQSLEWVTRLADPQTTKLNHIERQIAESILKEIVARLTFLNAVGVGYLTLHREAGSLAGGEAQRIRLASQIGTGLSGVLYILDEPTIGLHPQDNNRLIQTLYSLRDKGNTVVVVEHDRDVMKSSDWIVDFGPGAGTGGGEIVAQGPANEVIKSRQSLTAQYLRREKDVIKSKRISQEPRLILDNQPRRSHLPQPAQGRIQMFGANHHNLKSIDVEIPLSQLVCITGVSGSGKSTLLHDTLYPHLAKKIGKTFRMEAGHLDRIMVPDVVQRVVLIDQKPIGRTPRSNPATYSKSFDYIRQIFASSREAKLKGFGPSRFSFNTKGGRCEACRGDGQIKIEMQFLADVYVTCDVCHGSRYNGETLSVEYKGKTIANVLDMSIDEATKFFTTHSGLAKRLETLLDVGLGYMKLGQPAPTLSGGEAQRLKLAKELASQNAQHNIYLLDEPTTGLHFADVQKLLNVLDKLVIHNNTVVVIEHNLDIVKNADWVIDLGPLGGEDGGEVVAIGTPQNIADNSASLTGQYLKKELLSNS
ncbi:excinuclease ABC subunit UvrA [Patescibacteria group bacterium]|nr:excinuclease ABC subunit UvrA [Patescibacteria group bacterium]